MAQGGRGVLGATSSATTNFTKALSPFHVTITKLSQNTSSPAEGPQRGDGEASQFRGEPCTLSRTITFCGRLLLLLDVCGTVVPASYSYTEHARAASQPGPSPPAVASSNQKATLASHYGGVVSPLLPRMFSSSRARNRVVAGFYDTSSDPPLRRQRCGLP